MTEKIVDAPSLLIAQVPLSQPVEFPCIAVYIRLLSPEECRRPDIIKMIQNSRDEIDEIYGVFDLNGDLVGAAADRELAFEASLESGFRTQEWLC